MKVCLDASALAAAFTTRGLCTDVLWLVLTRHRLVAGRPVLAEVRRVLTERLGVPTIVADQVTPFLREHAEISSPNAPWPDVDLDQGWLLASAVHAGADLLITRSRSLVQHGPRLPLPVTTPRGFWQRLRAQGESS